MGRIRTIIQKLALMGQPGSMDGAFRGIVQRKHQFNTVIDVGAAEGRWSLACMRHFPKCNYLLLEAQPVHEKSVSKFAAKRPNVSYVIAAAGDRIGYLYFDARDPFGGQASYTPYPVNNIRVPVTTIDHEVLARNLPGPYLIKFDTHGFEVPILNGATKALANTEILIMECYNFKIARECLLFSEMCVYLEGFGFRCLDLIDPIHRPHDGCFWQMDIVFARSTRPEFACAEYH